MVRSCFWKPRRHAGAEEDSSWQQVQERVSKGEGRNAETESSSAEIVASENRPKITIAKSEQTNRAP